MSENAKNVVDSFLQTKEEAEKWADFFVTHKRDLDIFETRRIIGLSFSWSDFNTFTKYFGSLDHNDLSDYDNVRYWLGCIHYDDEKTIVLFDALYKLGITYKITEQDNMFKITRPTTLVKLLSRGFLDPEIASRVIIRRNGHETNEIDIECFAALVDYVIDNKLQFGENWVTYELLRDYPRGRYNIIRALMNELFKRIELMELENVGNEQRMRNNARFIHTLMRKCKKYQSSLVTHTLTYYIFVKRNACSIVKEITRETVRVCLEINEPAILNYEQRHGHGHGDSFITFSTIVDYAIELGRINELTSPIVSMMISNQVDIITYLLCRGFTLEHFYKCQSDIDTILVHQRFKSDSFNNSRKIHRLWRSGQHPIQLEFNSVRAALLSHTPLPFELHNIVLELIIEPKRTEFRPLRC